MAVIYRTYDLKQSQICDPHVVERYFGVDPGVVLAEAFVPIVHSLKNIIIFYKHKYLSQ